MFKRKSYRAHLSKCNNVNNKHRLIYTEIGRIHSRSGFSVKFECRAFPTLSTIAEVVIDDSMHRMAVTASKQVTSFLNINLACAATFAKSKCYGVKWDSLSIFKSA